MMTLVELQNDVGVPTMMLKPLSCQGVVVDGSSLQMNPSLVTSPGDANLREKTVVGEGSLTNNMRPNLGSDSNVESKVSWTDLVEADRNYADVVRGMKREVLGLNKILKSPNIGCSCLLE
ncbi:hypothetical protein Droror1_Dr00002482 [Drosera rotundifolia]